MINHLTSIYINTVATKALIAYPSWGGYWNKSLYAVNQTLLAIVWLQETICDGYSLNVSNAEIRDSWAIQHDTIYGM